ncbi:MAG: hypothetical protein M3Y93_10170, partial [Pseudomonadota bacterium]|nr:hypothetical protein [Pseudomonadota bacterium]
MLRVHAAELLADMSAEAIEAVLKFLAPSALFFAQRALQPFAIIFQCVQPEAKCRITTTTQQHDLQDDDDRHGDEQGQQHDFNDRHGVFRNRLPTSLRAGVSTAATGRRVQPPTQKAQRTLLELAAMRNEAFRYG